MEHSALIVRSIALHHGPALVISGLSGSLLRQQPLIPLPLGPAGPLLSWRDRACPNRSLAGPRRSCCMPPESAFGQQLDSGGVLGRATVCENAFITVDHNAVQNVRQETRSSWPACLNVVGRKPTIGFAAARTRDPFRSPASERYFIGRAYNWLARSRSCSRRAVATAIQFSRSPVGKSSHSGNWS
jgi:hypothetical protein